MTKKIFFLCGKTGGPFFPYKALSKVFGDDYEIIYLGVKNSFEEKIAKNLSLKIYFLPETKLGILSFKRQRFSELIKNLWDLLLLFIKLQISIYKSFKLILKKKPKAVFSTGSFLNIPVIISLKIYNFFSPNKIKLVVHQQDPLPGIANRFASKFADYLSCTFEYTKTHFREFENADKIPNPIFISDYKIDNEKALEKLRDSDSNLHRFFIQNKEKKVLLVFGGGSGSLDINNWLFRNLDEILQSFRVIHLTGVLQTKKNHKIENLDYFCRQKLTWQMPLAMNLSNYVLCRAGIGSATELTILRKKAFLVPLPHSHQELNAEVLADKFEILKQENMSKWLDKIKTESKKPIKFQIDLEEVGKDLDDYYQNIKDLLAE